MHKNLVDLSLFPTLVRVIPGFLNSEQCSELSKYLDSSELFNKHGLLEGPKDASTYYSGTKDIIQNISKSLATCEYLHTDLTNEINSMAATMGLAGPIVIDSSWANITHKKGALAAHLHPGSMISGALYIKTPQGSYKFRIFNPNPFNPYNTCPDDRPSTKYTYEWHDLEPTEGSLVLFPSWLKHGSDKENEADHRKVLSFNSSKY